MIDAIQRGVMLAGGLPVGFPHDQSSSPSKSLA